jgi:plasmid replication initiation protein
MSKLGISVDKNDLVVKANALIEARYKLPVAAQRVLVGCARKVKPSDDFDNTLYMLTVDEYESLFDVSNNSTYQDLRDAVDVLWDSEFTTYDENNVPTDRRWIISRKRNSRANYIGIRFHNDLKEFIFQLKRRFTVYEIGNISHLKSTYSIRIYELLKQYRKIKERHFEYYDLRNKLAINDGDYTLFGDFNRRILKQAQRELAENTDIRFEYKLIKKSRKVAGIKFNIYEQERKGKLSPQLPGLEKAPFTAHELYDELIMLGIPRKQAEGFLSEDPKTMVSAEQIKRNIEYFKQQRDSGKIRDSNVGFLAQAIITDYAVNIQKEIDNTNEQKKKKALELEKETLAQELSDLRADYDREVSEFSYSAYQKLPTARREAVFHKAKESAKSDHETKSYKEQGDKAYYFKVHVKNFMPNLPVPDELETFEAWRKHRGA